MRIGPMRHRLTIQVATLEQDDHGEPIETWGNIATNPHVWANIRSRAAGERFISGAEQVQATVSHTISIRYRDDLTPVRTRLVDGSHYYYIENIIDPTGMARELVLMCSEVQS